MEKLKTLTLTLTQEEEEETMEKLKTLTLTQEEEEEETAISFSFPIEIIEEILFRLPAKPLLQFKSVSKQWLSLISDDPSFPKLHFTRSLAANRTALLLTAYDPATEQRHFLSAPPDGGPVTHLITLDNVPDYDIRDARHLNGLVLFTPSIYSRNRGFFFVVNPATRKVFKLPVHCLSCFFFGFHQSRNEHYVFSIRGPFINVKPIDMIDVKRKTYDIEVMLYSLSTYSWRKIEIDEEKFPLRITRPVYLPVSSLCVNSVIHLMLILEKKILSFDLTTEKFSAIDIPPDAIPTLLVVNPDLSSDKPNYPYLMDINGCLGLVCHDRVVETNEIYLWKLQDYESCVWVKETVKFAESWSDLNCKLFVEPVFDMDKIVFSARKLSCDEVTVPIYDMKTKGLRLVQFTLGQQFLRSDTMEFGEVGSYVESILPLENNEQGLHEDDE